MVFIGQAYTGEDYGPRYFTVEITPARALYFLKYIDKVMQLKSEDHMVYSISLFCYDAEFYECCDILEAMFENVDTGSKVQPEVIPEINEDYICRMDSPTVEISENGIYFTAYAKHTSIYTTTAMISKEELQNIADAAECTTRR